MRCLTPFAVLVLIGVLALTGYNSWQINRMKADLVAVRANTSHGRSWAGDQTEVLAALRSAREHMRSARELLARGEVKRARLELDKSLRNLEKAPKVPADTASEAVRGVQKAVASVRKQVENMIEELSKQRQKGKPGDKGSSSSQ